MHRVVFASTVGVLGICGRCLPVHLSVLCISPLPFFRVVSVESRTVRGSRSVRRERGVVAVCEVAVNWSYSAVVDVTAAYCVPFGTGIGVVSNVVRSIYLMGINAGVIGKCSHDRTTLR